MALKVWVISTGMMGNNVCIIMNEESGEAFVVDPSYDPEIVLDFIQHHELKIPKILLTHGHFDHFAGVSYLFSHLPEKPQLGIHRDDLDLMMDGGGSKNLHVPVLPPGNPDFFLEDKQELKLGDTLIQVRLAPGHTPGSVIFYIPELKTAICGDLIFRHGVGRTDLEGGSETALISSIQNQVFTLPPDTRLIPGHGEETTVFEELNNNPFFNN
jgi:hydroxyacylglutathione hydrolase